MSDAPERIWAWENVYGDKKWWVDGPRARLTTEYIRVDLHAAEIAALRQQLDATLMELAETQALELQHGAVIERLMKQLAEALDACNQSRLAFAGFVSVDSALRKLDALSALKEQQP